MRAELEKYSAKVDAEKLQKQFGHKDFYGPITGPPEQFFRLPETCKVHFIATEEELKKAECLIGMELIGVDAEWRPGMTTFQQSKPALFQVGGLEQVCLFDMVALANNKALDELLERAFTQAGSVVIGFSFHNDLKAFAKSFPGLVAAKAIKKDADLHP